MIVNIIFDNFVYAP